MDKHDKNKAKIKISGEKIADGLVDKIAYVKSLDELKAVVRSILEFACAYPKYKKRMNGQLFEAIIIGGSQYLYPHPAQDKNVVFIPPDAAPIVMIPAYIQVSPEADIIRDGLKKLLKKLSEFSEPMEDIVTEAEMNAVLDNAQSKFGMMDIIAPEKPLKIVSFNHSHAVYNCECGMSASPGSRESVIFVYHPRDVIPCDRVFIFAHEIGHALHLALTGDVDIIPDKFDEFNEALNVDLDTIYLKQEAFANVAAFAMLNGNGLNKHLPHQFSETMLECYDKYIGYVTRSHLNQ